ncbi:aminoacyl-tRNA deacylase [Candidatus Pacearchaeota archaeon]|nr:aminoacyl-tRNA deacylase [Candidatus Pacearchaeota archaeon]
MDPILKAYLKKHNIQYQSYEHPEVFTVEEAKATKEQIPAQHAKCLFLKSNTGAFYLVGMKADKRLDINTLQKTLQVKKLRFASAEELLQKLKLTPGSVSIFGLIHSEKVIFLLDEEVWRSDSVGFHPNINTATLVLDHDNLEKYYDSLLNEKRIVELL